ncbi:hypothetical protein F2P56_019603 [Juglans regia]|uniref:Endonuclease/exonuclease/phosphatase domain-containing protein n=1 Tax=Juglans regia TaxID=51240 RepID=A0A833TH20_JUGRE|nr:hypothetical protein F2P56_019603 [Juglans regia]
MVTGWFQSEDTKFFITIVYARCRQVERRNLWQDLEDVHTGDSPWLVIGDFNLIREDGERIGDNPRSLSAMEEFNCCLDNCSLLDLAFVGSHMTWCNGHEGQSWSGARLDRAVINLGFSNCFLDAHYERLTRKYSDHCPMDFGRVDHHIKELEVRLESLQHQLQGDFSSKLEEEFLLTKLELDIWEQREERRFILVQSSIFQDFISGNRENDEADRFSLLEGVITMEDNESLCRAPVEEKETEFDAIAWFVEGSVPVIYLGAPLVVGRLKVRDSEHLMTKI